VTAPTLIGAAICFLSIGQIEVLLHVLDGDFAVWCEDSQPLVVDCLRGFLFDRPLIANVIDHPAALFAAKRRGFEHDTNNIFYSRGITLQSALVND